MKKHVGEETVTQRVNMRKPRELPHDDVNFILAAIVGAVGPYEEKSAARSKQDRVPKHHRNCDWNSNSETAPNCQTTLK